MTKKELAEKAGISKNTIQNIRNSKISFRNMVKIADVLEVSLDEFRKDNPWKAKVLLFFTKKGFKRIFLFEADSIDDMFRALEYDAFKDKKGRTYFLVVVLRLN